MYVENKGNMGMREEGVCGSVRKKNPEKIQTSQVRKIETSINEKKKICLCSKYESAELVRNGGQNMNYSNVGIL